VQLPQLSIVLVLWLWRLSLLCTTLGEGALPLSCDVVVVGWCFLVPSSATLATRVYLLVLVWLSRIILSKKVKVLGGGCMPMVG
jgi:hypothetical protein